MKLIDEDIDHVQKLANIPYSDGQIITVLREEIVKSMQYYMIVAGPHKLIELLEKSIEIEKEYEDHSVMLHNAFLDFRAIRELT